MMPLLLDCTRIAPMDGELQQSCKPIEPEAKKRRGPTMISRAFDAVDRNGRNCKARWSAT
jgi:hypothetical protein